MNILSKRLMIYKHVYHGIGLNYNAGEFYFFCKQTMRGPYRCNSIHTIGTINCITTIMSDLVDRDIPFTFTPPDFIKDGKVYDKNNRFHWWSIEDTNVCKIETVQSYYCETKVSTNQYETARKRYLDYLPCIEFESCLAFAAKMN